MCVSYIVNRYSAVTLAPSSFFCLLNSEFWILTSSLRKSEITACRQAGLIIIPRSTAFLNKNWDSLVIYEFTKLNLKKYHFYVR